MVLDLDLGLELELQPDDRHQEEGGGVALSQYWNLTGGQCLSLHQVDLKQSLLL